MPVLGALHWLPVKYRVEYQVLILTFKATHGRAPGYLSELLTPYYPSIKGVLLTNVDSLCLRPRKKCGRSLLTPAIYVHTGDKCFAKAGPVLWNSLPWIFEHANDLNIFKHKTDFAYNYSHDIDSLF